VLRYRALAYPPVHHYPAVLRQPPV